MTSAGIRHLLTLGLALAFAAPMIVAEPRVDAEGATPRPTATFAIPEVPPWGYESPEGEPAGVLVKFTEHLSRITRIPVAYRLRPYRRAIAELRSGKADFLMLFEGPEAEAPGITVGTLLESRVALVTLTNSGAAEGLADLSGRSVGYIEGTYYGTAFENADHVEKTAIKSLENGVDMMIRGHLSALVGFETLLDQVLGLPEYSEYDFNQRTIASGLEGKLYMSRHFTHTEYLPIFRGALEQMRRNGVIEDIIQASQ